MYVSVYIIYIYMYYIICWTVDPFDGFQKNQVDQLLFWCPIPPTPEHLVKGLM